MTRKCQCFYKLFDLVLKGFKNNEMTTNYQSINNLKVSKELLSFVDNELLKDIEITPKNTVRILPISGLYPNNPKNITATHPDGSVGRGVQYPFIKPLKGQFHSPWDEEKLEPWKEIVRQVLDYHYRNKISPLELISTEFIPNTDYGEGCKYSLFEQAIECTNWMRKSWNKIKKEY